MVLFAAVFLTVPFLPGSLCRKLTPQLLRGILGVVLRVKHAERLNKASPVIVTNHIHDYDTYLIPMLVPDTRPLISDHTTKIPVLGAILKRGYAPWAPLWVRLLRDGDVSDAWYRFHHVNRMVPPRAYDMR